MPKFPTPSKKAEIADRQRKVAALLLNRVHSAEIARNLGVDPATITRDVKAIKAEWGKEAQYDLSCYIDRELAELDRMELEAATLFQKAKDDGKAGGNTAGHWYQSRLNTKKMRIDLLGLDKITAITVQKMLNSEKTSDDKIIELKEAILNSLNKIE